MRSLISLGVAIVTLAASVACAAQPETDSVQEEATMSAVRVEPFGALPDGRAVSLYTLTSAGAIEVRVIDYGGIILSLRVPDRRGDLADITLGYDDLDGYMRATPYFGAIIGRYGNRIAGGAFTLDGTTYELARNNGPNHLHGGDVGFDKVLWEAEPFSREGARGVVFRYLSADGEEGYPGELSSTVTYTLGDDGTLSFDYEATTTAATPVNLTQHTYFNLAGHDAGDVLGHELTLFASRITPVDATLIPTGELRPVQGTPFDFRSPATIGARIDDDDEQLRLGGGYDHNFVLDRDSVVDGEPVLAAEVYEPASGRVMTVRTTEPGLQLYTGNFLDGSITGKGGVVYGHRHGFCLETQHYPDSPNQPGFPSTILRPGDTYRSRTVYAFSTR